MEHRLIMEETIGRFLQPEEVIHHINDKLSDNKPGNLELHKNQCQHMKSHHPEFFSIKAIIRDRKTGRFISPQG